MFSRLFTIVLLVLADLPVDAAPDRSNGNFASASFTQELSCYEGAEIAYDRCMECALKCGMNAELALTSTNLGVSTSDQSRAEESRKEHEEALKTYRELAQKNPENFLPEVARTLNNLGIIDSAQNRTEEARKAFGHRIFLRQPYGFTASELARAISKLVWSGI
jgi:tetratricopeptide (TPR) repeat protein